MEKSMKRELSPPRKQPCGGIPPVDVVAHADGDIGEDVGYWPLGKGQQKERHEDQHADEPVHRQDGERHICHDTDGTRLHSQSILQNEINRI